MALLVRISSVSWWQAARAAAVALVAAGWSPATGCDSKSSSPSGPGGGAPATVKVALAGKSHTLELCVDDKTRQRGLSERTAIPDGTGMIFVFTRAEERYFVMRDCPIPIDIMFVDATGRITAIHEMKPEPPRTEEEKKLTIPAGGQPWQGYNAGYEDRLTRYHSKFSAQYAIELAGGAIRKLGLAENQKLDLDPQLKKWAK